MSRIKRDIEAGRTTVSTARIVSAIILIVTIGGILLGISLGGWFF